MRILHTSDVHGRINWLQKVLEEQEYDIWIDSGDFFPNISRGNIQQEEVFQKKFLVEYSDSFRKMNEILGSRIKIFCPGNHDFISHLEAFGDGICVNGRAQIIHGFNFAGMREIPRIQGEWNGEVYRDVERDITEALFSREPDMIVCHAPPSCISRYGNVAMSTKLYYSEHKVKAIFCGHVHGEKGVPFERDGIIFSNAAQSFNIIEIPV